MRNLPNLSTALASFLLLLARHGLAQTPEEGEAQLEQMLADAKELAATSLPDRRKLGPEWKLPWELPPNSQYAAPSEEEYWERALEEMGWAGMSEAHARAAIDTVAQAVAAQGASEGITPRDGILTLLLRVKSTDAPTALKICDGWEAGARGFALAAAQKEQPDPGKAHRLILDLIAKPYAGQSDDQLKQLFVSQATLIRKRTMMQYFRCNNWPGLAQARSDQDIAKGGIWLGVVKLNLMMIDENRTDAPLDLKAEDCPKLEARLSAAIKDCMNGALAMRRKEVEALNKRANEGNDPILKEEAREENDALTATAAAIQQLAVKAQMKQFGDNSYVVRVTGISEDTAGIKFGLYNGWVRKGPVMCEISIGGNLPEKEMTTAMDQFLSEVDAKFMSYDSFMMKTLDVGAP